MRSYSTLLAWLAAVLTLSTCAFGAPNSAFTSSSTASKSLTKRGPQCNPRTDASCLAINPALSELILDTRYIQVLGDHFHSEGDVESSVTGEHISDVDEGDSDVQYDDLTISISNDYSSTIDLRVNQRFDNPVLVLNNYILYGKVLFELKSSSGKGVVSSAYLQSDDLDEIDILEIVGSDPSTFQSNYFVKGNTLNHERSVYHRGLLRDDFNRYSLEWTPGGVKWFVNDVLVRSVDRFTDTDFVAKHGLPSSPMVLKFSIWIGGDEVNSPGTIEWAGGLTDYSKVPFAMSVRNIRMEDYSNGVSYMYGNSEDSLWTQLHSVGGTICGRMPEPERQSLLLYIPVSERPKSLIMADAKGGQVRLVQTEEQFMSNDWEEQENNDNNDDGWNSKTYVLGANSIAPGSLKLFIVLVCFYCMYLNW